MKKALIPSTVSGGPSQQLLVALDRYLNDSPLDSNEEFHFADIAIQRYALESAEISENTALHKVLRELAYYEFFLYDYDDVDWADKPADFVEYATEMFALMDVEIPTVFLSDDPNKAVDARHEYSDLFVEGLNAFVYSAFAMAWDRKELLHRFNTRLAVEISNLKKYDFPELHSDGRIERVRYYPTWLVNKVSFRDRGCCHYCKDPVVSPLTETPAVHMDHMVPVAAGGTNDVTNFVLSCVRCNTSKGAKEQRIPDLFYWPQIQR